MIRPVRVAHVVALVVIGVCVPAVPARAAECPELVGRWPYGRTNAVAVSGSFAYFGSGTALVVADVSTPSTPHVVGDVTLPDFIDGVAVSGGYAYVADYEGGLRVIDVSTPSAPVEVGSYDTPGYAIGVAVAGSYAYVADYEGGLRVIDVSTPSAPVEVGYVGTPGHALGVAVADGYAYVAAGYEGLRVIDVSTPSTPVEVGLVDTPGYARGVAVAGDHAYVAAHGAGLRVIDVSTPSAPVEVGFVGTPGEANDVAVSGGYAYVADDDLRVVDVSTPSAPVEVGFVDSPGDAHGVAVAGAYAYVAAHDGLRVIDVSTPSSPVEVGSYDTPGYAIGVAVAGSYAYVAASNAGLRVIDVSTPSEPVEVGSYDTPGYAIGVAVAGSYAYVADSEGLRVIDVSTPSSPVEVGFYDTPGGASGVAVAGHYAYVTWQGVFVNGFRVIDVSTPSAPVDVGSLESRSNFTDVAVSGGYAYVAGHGLHVIDVSTPSAPVEVGFVNISFPWGWANGVAVAGSYAYVTTQEDLLSYLRVIDVSTPSAPVEVGSLESWYNSTDVAVSGGHVFVAGWSAGLYIFDECDPLGDPRECFIPAAAMAAGAQGAFFQTDVEINNPGAEEAQITLQWLPRGEDNSEPVTSDPIALAAGQSLRWENVLTEVFGLGPDSLGALKLVASTDHVIGMSRTYNIPAGKAAGTFGQGLPAIRASEMIKRTHPRRILFLSEDPDFRANVGCVNGTSDPVTINVGLFNAEGSLLETKTMDLGPYSNEQINRIFQDYAPVYGHVDVWADSDEALYYCYGSMLDNSTSDPTTILPQVPSYGLSFVPAAALAAGAEGSFFTTDLDLNNAGSTDITYQLLWLPRGADNSDPIRSDPFSLAPGAGVRYANVLDEVFGLEPDQVGALAVEASGIDLLAMSRTYNLPSAKVAGTFGQGLPGIPANQMIPTGVTKRILLLSENDDVRSNVGCINGAGAEVAVAIDLYDSDGVRLETKYMMLPPYSNRQINGIFQDYAPVNGYVDVRTYTPDASIYCYGSVLDNLTSDPTTVLPQ
jgi:hypothetical protein